VNSGKMIFSQLMDFLPSQEFRRCVDRYKGNYKLQRFSCWDQFLCMAFAQLTYRESLRDIEACLRSAGTKLYHMGIRNRVARNTLANANQVRDWRIYADFAHALIATARELYIGDSFGLDLQQTVYAMDSTMIDLCLSLFPWAKYRKRDGAVKLHTLLDLRGNIPSVVIVTHGKVHDVNFLHQLIVEPGAFYVMDRGYLDFERLHTIGLASAFFVIRAKSHIVIKRLYSRPVDKSTGVRSDQIITFSGFYAHKDYPDKLRRIHFYDNEKFHLVSFHHRSTLSLPMASRTLLQVDQTASTHQGFLRHFRKRSEDSDLDRDFHIRPCGDHKKTPQPPRQSLQNSPDPQRQRLRENAHSRGSF
jgi:uncharacterized protein DUF4372/DDE family transposase